MNATPPRPGPTSSRAERAHGHPRHRDATADARCAGDFDRLLRDKAGRHDHTGANANAEHVNEVIPTTTRSDPLPTPPSTTLPPTKPVTSTPPSSLSTPIDPPTATQLNLLAATTPTADTARTFEVSIKQPLGTDLTFLATRPIQAAESHAGARWSLSISSANLNPSVLRRYSSRLDERLSSRQLPHEPVRIENDEEPR